MTLSPDAIDVADALNDEMDGALTTVITMLAEYPDGETEPAVIVYDPAAGAVQMFPAKLPPVALQFTAVLAEPFVVAVK